MNPDITDVTELLIRAAAGDEQAKGQLLDLHRDRLKRMVRVRLNPRLQGRIDDSDVVQEVYLEANRRLPEYLGEPRAPFFLWLRSIASHKLVDVHRRHLGAQARNAQREISLHRGPLPLADTESLAAQLLGRLTSPSGAAIKAEARVALQEVLNSMDEIDREILAMRHFEQLTNMEVAAELDIQPSAASKRYIRALARLQERLTSVGFTGDEIR